MPWLTDTVTADRGRNIRPHDGRRLNWHSAVTIASLTGQIALPEVKLGILPAGGTQRSPRLMGGKGARSDGRGRSDFERAGQEAGLVDEVVSGDPCGGTHANRLLKENQGWREPASCRHR
jgi:enoyl-CoA hydratase/carnithine racemase